MQQRRPYVKQPLPVQTRCQIIKWAFIALGLYVTVAILYSIVGG